MDIDAIHEYIHERNPRAATVAIERIQRAAERLGVWPHIGHAGRLPGTFEWVVAPLPYVIVYEVDERVNEAWILAIFHGAQQRG